MLNKQITTKFDFRTIRVIQLIGILFLQPIVCISNSGSDPKTNTADYPGEEYSSREQSNLPINQLNGSYFHVVFTGNGVDHMNINLVNLKLAGLALGDEIGVFDSIYCVGALTLSAKHIAENSISIPASANDASQQNPNGYTEGNKISLKLYRNGTVYRLYFETVNNSKAIFEAGGSMFAFINFSLSTGNDSQDYSNELKIYPNPFNDTVQIEISLNKPRLVICEILDMSGKLITTLFNGEVYDEKKLIWDGKDSMNKVVQSGIYLCRLNHSITKIIYKGIAK